MSTLPPKVLDLVDRFDAIRESYTSGHYNETQLRREFIDPFFEALGWHEKGYAEPYKKPVHEDAFKTAHKTKAPDYCFRVGSSPKFFVDAKKPSGTLKGELAPSYQVRRYAWSAKLPLSILTDFEDFAIFDCRIRPQPGDKPSTARIFHCTFRDYAAKWSEIESVFSQDAILKGSFDKYADTAKRGTQSVDDAFLCEIERWREIFARCISSRNDSLTSADLNFAVQRTIDRIVFLRICEDRGIEPYGRLLSLCGSKSIYSQLCDVFRRADDKYNSGLFHFGKEGGRADALTPRLMLDDEVLNDILSNLYYPKSPFEFSVLPSDILGQVYERFLGKEIRLSAGHEPKIDEKPEVRKAGGVYYTPPYVVDYVVRSTVGRLLTDGTTPKQVSALRILDPACGSGSFLLGVYQFLLEWHRRWYVENGPEKHGKTLFRDARDEWQLTTAKRKEILQNNIFGVDLDDQAVEVTKLSLLLKVLEGEADEALSKDLRLSENRALPDLGGNIQCGNSLIDAAYYKLDGLVSGSSETRATNPFDWHARFPEIFVKGGFDVVLGNPPYLSYGGRQVVDLPEPQRRYFEEHYDCAGWATAHSFFMERSSKLLSKHFVSFIVPDQVGHLDGYRSLRKVLLSQGVLREVKYWGENVFRGVTTPSLTFVLDKTARDVTTSIINKDGSELSGSFQNDEPWTVSSSKHLMAKLSSRTMSIRPFLADCGVRTTDKKAQVVPLGEATGQFIPTLGGKQVGRYSCSPAVLAVRLDKGDVFRRKDEKYRSAKYLIRQTAAYPIVGPHDHETHFRNSLHGIYEPDNGLDIRYFVGILNSKLIRFSYVKMTREASQRVFPQVKLTPLGQLPIRMIDRNVPEEASAHDRIVGLVEQLLTLNRARLEEHNPSGSESLRHQIEKVDTTLDREVYRLYELDDTEIAEIESFVATLPVPP